MALSPGNVAAAEVPRFLRSLEGLVDAGLPALVLREPGWGAGAYLELAKACQARLQRGGAALVLHDRPHLVRAAGAQGVHLGWRSLPPERVRPLVPQSTWIGLSTHAGDGCPPGVVDYCSYGPVFPTPSKAGLVEPVGLQGLQERARWLRGQATRPPALFALGGLDVQHVGELRAIEVGRFMVRGALWSARSPERACRALAQALTEASA